MLKLSNHLNDNRVVATAEILRDLYTDWTPHEAQAQVLYSLFYDDIKNVFAECGRKFGKTELAMDLLRRFALLHPGSGNYYIAPAQKQAKEILWVTQRMQKMIPQKFIAKVNHTEMRIILTNGSFIKLDGSDNTESYRGITPHCLVYDEAKDHDPNFHIAMNPNRAVHNAPLLVIGTPPELEGYATELKEEFLSNPSSRYFNFPSSCNPHISKEWLDAEKKRLFDRGEEDIWFREYEAKFVRGGRNAIFPMLDEAKHQFPHEQLRMEIARDAHKMDWFVIADPGSTSIFAVLFAAYNRYTKVWYLLDEIYESDQRETSVSKILPRIKVKVEALNPMVKWGFVFDEAAAWFYTEATSGINPSCPIYPWTPTNKAAMARDPLTKEPWGISLIKDTLRFEKCRISDKCKWAWYEMVNYTRTRNRAGDIKILKRSDHLIDCWRYALEYAGFSLQDIREPQKPIDEVRRKVYRLEDDMKADKWMLPFVPRK